MRASMLLVAGVSVFAAAGCVGLNAFATPLATMASANAAAQQPESTNLLLFGGEGHKTFLGCFCSQVDQNSLTNPISPFGSTISPTSIFNHLSIFGSSVGQYSACNTLATDPPIVVSSAGQAAGRLTLNTLTPGAMTQPDIVAWLRSVCTK